MGKNGHDLWGWACSDTADEIQQNFEGVVDFDMVCNRGVCSSSCGTAFRFMLTNCTGKHVAPQYRQRRCSDTGWSHLVSGLSKMENEEVVEELPRVQVVEMFVN
jgi:hypothetical protein